ncbi:hypothetical protein D9758_010471 [Tetrapyrgos nigripes]|uniref:Chromo domain-containing protein n=1 Tax=Tetrapyrgos nigripes TaxID=182062 RepID=A0A8H5CZK9_9AGAR|nr:hypothetical protein D9758_010471 [Tetrapyrgos nigripes]
MDIEQLHSTIQESYASDPESQAGPFKVIAHPSSLLYTLKLPDYLHTIHPIFHVSQLEPAVPNTILNQQLDPLAPVEIEGELQYEITEILDSKFDWHCQKCPLLYMVQWSGYEGTDKEFSWILADELTADEAIADFHKKNLTKPSPLPL